MSDMPKRLYITRGHYGLVVDDSFAMGKTEYVQADIVGNLTQQYWLFASDAKWHDGYQYGWQTLIGAFGTRDEVRKEVEERDFEWWYVLDTAAGMVYRDVSELED